MALCNCGCGGETKVASVTRLSRGSVKGQPFRFIYQHSARMGLNFRPGPMYEVLADGCWRWTRSLDGKGYGQIAAGGKMYRAHRAVYEGNKGPIPKGTVLDHLCGRRDCVNPDHMEPVSHSENLKRGGYAHGSAA